MSADNTEYQAAAARLDRALERLEASLRHLGGRPTREGLISSLEGLSGYESRGYRLHFGPTKHVGSNFVELSMLTADGKVRR